MKRPLFSFGPINRTRKAERDYVNYRRNKNIDCDFCNFNGSSDVLIKEYSLFWHVINKFGYATWDGYCVREHSMIVPKRHAVSISEFTPEESQEYIALISKFEKEGNSIYSRSDKQVTKSIPHQHTHLIQLEDKQVRSLIYNHSPHILTFR